MAGMLAMALILGGASMVGCTNKATNGENNGDSDSVTVTETDSTTLSTTESDAEECEEDSTSQDSAYENEVWPYLGGTYAFGDEDGDYAYLEVDLEDDSNCTLSIKGKNYKGKIAEDGRITAYTGSGQVAFVGYVYAGGNLLKGKLFGKDIRYNGLCGL